MSQSRQLAAIMFTDIVGYTALMGANEQKTFELLKKNRQIQKPLIEHYRGRWIKEMGDGVLASFSNATDAVQCAIAIQQTCQSLADLKLHIGIHLGEVVFEKGDIFGDGVNIASRLESLAPPCDVLISEAVYTNIKNKGFNIEFFREERLKNVEAPVRIYRIKTEGHTLPQQKTDSHTKKLFRKVKHINGKMLTPFLLAFVLLLIAGLFFYMRHQRSYNFTAGELTEKSIAVLPFVNMSNDPQQEYFSEGMMDEILNHLFKIGGLRVISRTSAMAFKDTKKTMKEIASELGVANLLEGSVQKEGQRIRIIVQLINGKTDEHIWAETYDREFKDVFAIQSDVAQNIAAELKVKIDPSVKERIEYRPTENTEAYNIYLLARSKWLHNNEEWKNLLEQVSTLDPKFAPPYADQALYWIQRGSFSGNLTVKEIKDKALSLLNKAISLDSNLASAYGYRALIYVWYDWDFENAGKNWQKVLELTPSGMTGLNWKSEYNDFLLSSGRFKEAVEFADKGFEDKNNPFSWLTLSRAYHMMGQLEKAIEINNTSLKIFNQPLYQSWFLLRSAEIKILQGKYTEVLNDLDQAIMLNTAFQPLPRIKYLRAVALYQTGDKSRAEQFLDEVKASSKISPVGSPSYYLAAAYSLIRQNDMAMQWLGKAYQDHEVELYWLKVEPMFQSLHNNTQFLNIVNKIGFPK